MNLQSKHTYRRTTKSFCNILKFQFITIASETEISPKLTAKRAMLKLNTFIILFVNSFLSRTCTHFLYNILPVSDVTKSIVEDQGEKFFKGIWALRENYFFGSYQTYPSQIEIFMIFQRVLPRTVFNKICSDARLTEFIENMITSFDTFSQRK